MKELNETKNRLLANVSHDLRTPLNSIINNIKMAELEIKSNYFHMFQSEKSKSCLEQIQKYHTMINSNSQMLLLLVHDILDHTRSQHKQIQINPEKFSILDLISEMKELLSFPAENKQIKLEFSINLEDQNLYQDKLRLKQIIMNLMGNAIKFTTKGYVKLTVKSVKNHLTGQLLEFSIEDTGIGIKDEQQKHLFQNFSCDDNESGLNPHGIDTRENGSSYKEETDNIQENQITKSLPIMNTQNLTGQYQSLTILLVDDNPFNIQTIKNIIQQAMKGYFQIQFEVAYDGQQALDKISELQNKKMSIDLMIIDYEMPILNGAETMEIIIQMQQQQKIDSKMKVWLCSANGIENDIKPKILKKFSQQFSKKIQKLLFFQKQIKKQI
ncbi:Signal transduction histidine kinase, homodimeric domain [Pseudocohnilembus persalinus]|uniref:Signal transduction histidine kinase, homodimeric domain n=1 Tax=Pseudocohnilembus persalinus TaxID=266149 RepID=A0A0V0R045_PSEPJ|nr:Signal transduction histidine kinase, homodimeric domain [Pseudocohnilembus persalinus]|eukprot:KRX07664.1 Signal transduction histidine kinase, homodimeric domain [Pseudocohnilembus persalinus]